MLPLSLCCAHTLAATCVRLHSLSTLCAIVILPATVKGREPATSIGHFRWLGLPCPETFGAPCPSSSTTIREGASEKVSQSDASVLPPGRWQTRLAVLWTVPSLAREHSPSPACHMTSPARDRANLCAWYCPWQKPDARFQGANQGAVPPRPAPFSTWWWGAQEADAEVASQPCWHCIRVNASKNMLEKRKAFIMSPGLPLSCEVLTTVIAYHVKQRVVVHGSIFILCLSTYLRFCCILFFC